MQAQSPERLRRYNVVLADRESAWLDQFAAEIHTTTGAKVSRSEIVRAAIAGMTELHRLAVAGGPSWFPPLTSSRSGSDLAMLTVLAARCATKERL